MKSKNQLVDETRTKIFKNLGFMTLSVTDVCTSGCKYCYLETTYSKRNGVILDHDLLHLIFKTIFIKSEKIRAIKIQFFGGEPLAVGVKWYKRALPIIRTLAEKNNISLDLVIQSNFINLSRDEINYYNNENIQLNISLDGPPMIHNRLRKSGEQTINNLKRYIETTERVPGAIMVVGGHNINELSEIIDYFYSEFSLASVNLQWLDNPYNGDTQFELASPLRLDGIKKVFEFMHKTKGNFAETNASRFLRMFFDPIYRRTKRSSRCCQSLFCMAWNYMFSFLPGGEIIGCDVLFGLHDQRGLFIQDIEKDPVLFRETLFKKCNLCHVKSEDWARCEGCDAFSICDFGCTALYKKNNRYIEEHCEYIKGIFSFIRENETKYRELYQIAKQGECKADNYMIEVAASKVISLIPSCEKKELIKEVVKNNKQSIFEKQYGINRFYTILNELENENLKIERDDGRVILFSSSDKNFIHLKCDNALYEVDKDTYRRIINCENKLLTNINL